MVSFEIFVKAMPPSLSELKVLPSFCFAFKIPDDVTASNTYYHKKYTMNNRTSLLTEILAMNISWLNEDLELFENSFDLTTSLVFTLARFITLILAIIVHRAFYRLMKRLPGRAVNTLIYPYMVSYQESVLFTTTWYQWRLV